MQSLDRELLSRPPRSLTVKLILLATNLGIEGNLEISEHRRKELALAGLIGCGTRRHTEYGGVGLGRQNRNSKGPDSRVQARVPSDERDLRGTHVLCTDPEVDADSYVDQMATGLLSGIMAVQPCS
jgi:hypothetical protein